jgi:hypothetical protein
MKILLSRGCLRSALRVAGWTDSITKNGKFA